MSRVIKSTRFIRITPETCRVCLRDLQRNLLKEMSEYADNLQELEPKTLAEVYEISTGYRIFEPPGSPTKICFVCETTLIKLYTFKQEVDIAEASLIQLCRGNISKPAPASVKREAQELDALSNQSGLQHHSVADTILEHHLEDEEQLYEANENQHEEEVQIFASSHYVMDDVTEIEDEERLELHDDSGEKLEDDYAVQMITTPDNSVARRYGQFRFTIHACTICPAKFKTASQLKSHLVVHSDQRNFACSMCDKRFKTKKTLKGHEETHSSELMYFCDLCKQGFTNRTALRVHNFRRHGGGVSKKNAMKHEQITKEEDSSSYM